MILISRWVFDPYHFSVPSEVKSNLGISYSVLNKEDEIAVEVFSLHDLYLMLANSAKRARFERDLDLLEKLRVKAVVIEATQDDIAFDAPANTLPAKDAAALIAGYRERNPDVEWVFCSGRAEAETLVESILLETERVPVAAPSQPTVAPVSEPMKKPRKKKASS